MLRASCSKDNEHSECVTNDTSRAALGGDPQNFTFDTRPLLAAASSSSNPMARLSTTKKSGSNAAAVAKGTDASSVLP
jgi:hypothetical protein